MISTLFVALVALTPLSPQQHVISVLEQQKGALIVWERRGDKWTLTQDASM